MAVFVVARPPAASRPRWALVAARVAQAAGAAWITPTSLALLREAYQQFRDRAARRQAHF
jgi:MFS transporter, DHA2 family, methylenomycin A resistance protein